MSMKVGERTLGVEYVVAPGTYFLGDPCYTTGHDEIGDDIWAENCEKTDFDRPGNLIAIEAAGGLEILSFGTAYGDGGYYDQYRDQEYSVDSGCIGLVPIEMLTITGVTQDELTRLGRIVTFDRDTVCRTNGSLLQFGKYKINTDDEEDD